MKHILMACGTGICTSSAVRERVCQLLDERGYAGRYDVTQCRMADVPELADSHDFLTSTGFRSSPAATRPPPSARCSRS